MTNPNYRITIEPLTEEAVQGFPEELQGGAIECEGFALLADKGRSSTVLIQGVSTADIATMLAANPTLMAAGQVAKAIRKAEAVNVRSTMFSDLIRKIENLERKD